MSHNDRLPFDREEEICSDEDLIELGSEILTEEASALGRAADRLDAGFVRAARLIASCRGRVVVSGLGKSGLVGRKTASTFASLGVPAFFLHAAEGPHGDLGMVRPNDVGLFISNSGETAELLSLLPYFRRIGAPVIAMTGRSSSTLANNSDVFLDVGVEREADPLGLAPTNSTTIQMAVGDALAVVLTRLRRFGPEDFALFHPGGTLGRILNLRVSDIYIGNGRSLPSTKLGSTVRDALFEITSKGYGATVVVDDDGAIRGIFTDGDLRRLMGRRGSASMDLPIEEGMTYAPLTIEPDTLASEAVRIMGKMKISVLVAAEDNRPMGMIHLHELVKAGLS
ncbi:MAG: KpsF/GutQ family sugar-phosphate isomerase [Synergistaceae bacterium]|jgi:arabinose-5-phosphate isomerase|nr:KpsF/GutQ family sugar-phosphate isomerase [Synergistaceae bacterium]